MFLSASGARARMSMFAVTNVVRRRGPRGSPVPNHPLLSSRETDIKTHYLLHTTSKFPCLKSPHKKGMFTCSRSINTDLKFSNVLFSILMVRFVTINMLISIL